MVLFFLVAVTEITGLVFRWYIVRIILHQVISHPKGLHIHSWLLYSYSVGNYFALHTSFLYDATRRASRHWKITGARKLSESCTRKNPDRLRKRAGGHWVKNKSSRHVLTCGATWLIIYTRWFFFWLKDFNFSSVFIFCLLKSLNFGLPTLAKVGQRWRSWERLISSKKKRKVVWRVGKMV